MAENKQNKPITGTILAIDNWVKQNPQREIRSSRLFDNNSNSIPASDGLFSENIFGAIGSPERMQYFGFIRLKAPHFHPLIYKNVLTLKRLYEEILSGKTYAVFDKDQKDFIKATNNTEGADTGYQFFMSHFNKLSFEGTASLARKDKITIFEKYKDRLICHNYLVLPAGFRDVEVKDDVVVYDEINKIYQKLIALTKALPEENNTDSLYDSVRYKIQKTLLEIYQYFADWHEGKKGFLQGKYISRSVSGATRNVATSFPTSAVSTMDDRQLQSDEVAIGLYQTAKAYQPSVVFQLRTIFFNMIFGDDTGAIPLVDEKTHEIAYVQVDQDIRDLYTTSTGIIKLISRIRTEDMWFKPVRVQGDDKPHFLYMVYDTGDEIFFYRSRSSFNELYKEQFGKEPSGGSHRGMTYSEMFYLAVYNATYDKYGTVTRYPVINDKGIIPVKVKLVSTNPGRKVTLYTPGDININVQCPEYPIINNGAFVGMAVHCNRWQGLGQDNDGDTLNFVGCLTEETNEEIKQYLNGKAAYVTPMGDLYGGISTDIGNIICRYITK